MDKMINNYYLGNLIAARKQAKRFTTWQIREDLTSRGYSFRKASLLADCLKGRDCWQEVLHTA